MPEEIAGGQRVTWRQDGNLPAPRAVAPPRVETGDPEMLELAAAIVVSAVALTFLSDATSSTLKMVRASRRRGTIRVADSSLSQH